MLTEGNPKTFWLVNEPSGAEPPGWEVLREGRIRFAQQSLVSAFPTGFDGHMRGGGGCAS